MQFILYRIYIQPVQHQFIRQSTNLFYIEPLVNS